MKLLRYLNEENDIKLDIINKNCKKILDLYKKTGIYLYRGIKKDYDDLTLIKVRKNRKPRDTPLFIHKNIDEYFFKKFGYKARSTSIFATSDKNTAGKYGKEYIIFPVGDDWTMIWSPKVNDLFMETDQLDITDIDDILNTYQLGHEEQAIMSDNEVMIVNCDEYYVLRYNKNSLATLAKMLNINNDNYFNWNDWEGGTWHGGWWHDGTWKKGTWKKGTWENGTWFDGTWEDGIWKGGIWKNGTWKKGKWKNGSWKNGTWENGVWHIGQWFNGTWKGGIWIDGPWDDGIWLDGTWYSGTWLNGTWKGGTWEDGIWKGGIWKDGWWEKGKILNPITKKYEESDVNPAEFYKKIGYKG